MNEYKKFSYYFDEVVSSLNYDLWLEFIEPYLNENDTVFQPLISSLKLKYGSEKVDQILQKSKL